MKNIFFTKFLVTQIYLYVCLYLCWDIKYISCNGSYERKQFGKALVYRLLQDPQNNVSGLKGPLTIQFSQKILLIHNQVYTW